MTVTWIFIPHPNTIMTWLCFVTIPLHQQVGGTVNWFSMCTGICLSCAWGIGAAMDTQLNDARRSSQMGIVTATGQMFLVQSGILQMQRVLPTRIHMGVLGGYAAWHFSRFTALQQRREIS